MAELRRLEINVVANTASAETSINSLNKSVDKTEQNLSGLGKATGGASSSFASLALGVAGGIGLFTTVAGAIQRVGQEVLDFAKAAVNSASQIEQMGVAFKTMLGSAEAAGQFTRDLIDFAKKTPFELQGLRQASQQLLAYGFTQEEVLPNLKALGDIASGVGLEKLPNLILALGQVRAAGRLTGMELRQFTEAGVPMLEELGKVMNKSVSEIKDMVSNGEVGFQDVQKALANLTGEGGRFNNLMDKQAKTFGGLMSNLKDGWNIFLAQVGEKVLPVLKNVILSVTNFVSNTLPGLVNGFINLFDKLKPALIGLLALISPFWGAIVGGIALFRGAVDKNIAGLGDFFGTEFNKVKEAVASMDDTVAKDATQMTMKIREQFAILNTSASKDFATFSENIIQSTNGLVNILTDQFTKVADTAKTAIEGFTQIGLNTNLATQATQVIDTITAQQIAKAQEQQQQVIQLTEQLKTATGAQYEEISANIQSITTQMSNQVVSNYQIMTSQTISQLEYLKSQAGLVATAQMEEMAQITIAQADDQTKKYSDYLGQIEAFYQVNKDNLNETQLKILEDAINNATTQRDKVVEQYEGMKNEVLDKLQTQAEGQGLILIRGTGEVISHGQYIWRYIKILLGDLGKIILAGGELIVRTLVEVVQRAFNSLILGLKAVVAKIKDTLMAPFVSFSKGDIVQGIKDIGKIALDTVTLFTPELASGFASGFKEGFSGFGASMENILETSVSPLQGTFLDGFDTINKRIQDGVGGTKKSVEDLGNKGQDLGELLKKLGNQPGTKGAGAGGTNEIVNARKKELEINLANAKTLEEKINLLNEEQKNYRKGSADFLAVEKQKQDLIRKDQEEQRKQAEDTVKENISNLKKIQDMRDKLSRTGIGDVFGKVSTASVQANITLQDKLRASISDQKTSLDDLFKDWDAGYKEINDALTKLESDHKSKLDSINKSLQDVATNMQKASADFLNKRTAGTGQLATDIANEVVKAEENIKRLEAERASTQDAQRQNEIQKEIDKERAIINGKQQAQTEYLKWVEQIIKDNETRLVEVKKQSQTETDNEKKIALLQEQALIEKTLADQQAMRTKIDTEIEKARKLAGATDLEKIILEFQDRMKVEQEQFTQEIAQLTIRQTQLQLIKDAEIAMYEQKKAEIIAFETEITNTFLANLTAREAAEVASVDRLVAKYAELARARAEAGLSVFQATQPQAQTGFLSGGFTGQGLLNQIAGVVHKNEYVVPAWLLNRFSGVIAQIEKIRKRGFAEGGYTTPQNNTTYNQPININANVNGEVDFNNVARFLSWQLRGN